eukprot:TRINITY_DN426_c0_g1_i4.p3 TRINITY_DN426_c0_g1~~TRINITY_DN426_c0_g1_i4.p3  ORF type:complete len:377 (+),score=37.08 TRINITY_DN426_c0_g1_i4:3345-4475(+)
MVRINMNQSYLKGGCVITLFDLFKEDVHYLVKHKNLITKIANMVDYEAVRPILKLDHLPHAAIYVNVVLSGIIFVILCFTCVQFIENICYKSFKKINLNFFFFYLALQFLLLCRMLYNLSAENLIQFPEYLYGVWCYFPSLLAITCALFFIDTMIFSLLDAKGKNHLKKYSWTRLIPLALLLITWIGGLLLFAGIVHQNYNPKKSKHWNTVYYYFSAILVWTTCLVLIFMTIKFMSELKKFLHVYNRKKGMLYKVLIVMIIQLCARVAHLVLAGQFLNNWEQECVEDNNPSVFIYYGGYFCLCDVVPSIVFNSYLGLEIYHREQVTSEESESTVSVTSVVAKLEEIYRKKSDKESVLRVSTSSFLSDDNSSCGYKD